ncbi:hypothetical protein Rahaq2_4699 (plasmid) [Rahnella aquatilis CIP 78.65 = ATCC 33071]|uniref:Uncharacterized protein n=1 Tax=Rahnella aquatilis (strain ATCC 33071 / DSM 4594 / JCM 1683 / NBRC 105701 / NCIMB 13365 / CIP 78.65) TaxID=745277 RepID=H2J1H7_RAHAC|nr:hypothetical protein Rahaq2_4699 [Rahnella aquatilis CIP 78.65 = ATCC 33071]
MTKNVETSGMLWCFDLCFERSVILRRLCKVGRGLMRSGLADTHI